MSAKQKQSTVSRLSLSALYTQGIDDETIPFGYRFRGQPTIPSSFRLPQESLAYIEAAQSVFASAGNRSQALIFLIEVALEKIEHDTPELYECMTDMVQQKLEFS